MGQPFGSGMSAWKQRQSELKAAERNRYWAVKVAQQDATKKLRQVASNMLNPPYQPWVEHPSSQTLTDCAGCGAPRTKQKCKYCGRGQ